MVDIPISNPDSKEVVADWIEWYVAYEEQAISKSEVSANIEKWKGTEPEDSFIDFVWDELKRRESLYGENPPFSLNGPVVNPKINWRTYPEYMMCLILSILGNKEEVTKTGKLFERLSGEAIRKYINGNIIIFGFPSDQTVSQIANQLNEKFNSEIPAHRKDRGLDIIAWKPFNDNRPSQLIVLFQCASGHNWSSKLLFPLKAWCNYISWACNPITGFALPSIINERDFREYANDGGILIDRTRLYRFTTIYHFEGDLRNKMEEWCDQKLLDLSEN